LNFLLQTKGLTKHFGGLAAVYDLDLAVFEGEILGLVGPNGAGKTTVFNLLSGFLHPTTGSVTFQGRDITALAPHEIARAGIARVFQQGLTFRGLSVTDSILVGFQKRYRTGLASSVLRTSRARAEERALQEEARRVLDFVGLERVAEQESGSLPHGQQMALGLAVALASQPKLLLLDEPATGMNPSETDLVIAMIKKLHESGVTIVVVEHNMRVVRSLCDRLVCMNFGEKLCEGDPGFVTSHPEVCEAYLGKGGFHAP
jgi:branched-chain amino acid transport system ATP-binding protein